MSDQLLQRAREARTSGAVLKVRLSNVRARYPHAIVLIFEGDEDVGPYGAWIARINDQLIYEPLPGKGKGQLLDLRRRLKADTNKLSQGVYFFVDRDFDELRGQSPGNDVYCSDSYSVENDLISEHAFAKILSDEFRCTAETFDRETAVLKYRGAVAQFANAMTDVNRRLFSARALQIDAAIVDSISKYVDISLDHITKKYSDASIQSLIKLAREPTADELVVIQQKFAELDPFTRYRGKFWLAFFLRWLEELAAERRQCTRKIFSSPVEIKFAASQLSLSALAIKSKIPIGLGEFISFVAASA